VDTKRSRRVYVLWAIALTLLLTGGLVCWRIVIPYLQARGAVRAQDPKRLGPPAQAARKLSVYLRLSRFFPGEPGSRETATWYLGEAGGEEAVPELIDTLKDSDMSVRRYAALALGEIGPAASEASPALAAALQDSNGDVRYAATGALGRIGPAASEAVPALTAALKDSDVAVRRTAAESLGQIGPGASEAVPALVEALQDPDAPVHVFAAQALGRIGPGAAGAIPALRAALADPNGDNRVRKAAAEALEKIKAAPEKKL